MNASTMLAELGITREVVIEQLAQKVLDEMDGESIITAVRSKVVTKLLNDAGPRIEEVLGQSIADLVDADFTPVDEWGEPTRKEATSLRKLTKEKATKYLAEKVDKDGKASSYGSVGTRGEWMARKAAEEAITYECKRELEVVIAKAKSEVLGMVMRFLTDTIGKQHMKM